MEGVRYVPDLSESICSLFVHFKCPRHGIHSSFEDGLQVSFPEFTTDVIIGENDINLNAIPGNDEIK